MIIDSIRNFAAYSKLAPSAWEKVAAFLKTCTPHTPAGRYELDGDRVYAMVQCYETHPADLEKFEVHRKYVDIQLLLDGQESIICGPVDGLRETAAYNTDKDVAFYELDLWKAIPVTLVPGNFAVLLPEEGHMPGVTCAGELYCKACPGLSTAAFPPVKPRTVVKIVVKIAAELLN